MRIQIFQTESNDTLCIERDNPPSQVGGFPIVINTANSYSYINPKDKGDKCERVSTGFIGQHHYG
jgi:hypothetical protein